MSFFAVVAHSEDIDAQGVLDDLMEQCEEKLGGRSPNAGILFSAIDMEHDLVLKGIDDAWPGLELIGCTTDGEISSQIGFREDSISLVLFGSDTIDIKAGLGRNVGADVSAACREAVESARAKSDLPPALCITLPESMTASGQRIVEALVENLDKDVPVLGATAGDQWRMKGTVQFCGRESGPDMVPVLMFSGPLIYSIGVESGWTPVGEPGLITRSEGNILHEIDGRPALDFYKRFLGDDVVPSPECSLAILDDQGEIECLRGPFGLVDDGSGAIIYAADVREGAMVQITTADRSAILDGCTESVRKAFADYPHGKTPEATLIFSCAARKLMLGTRTAEEISIVESVIGTEVPVCGFYGYGEIGPRDIADTSSKYHNSTFVSLIMGT